MIICPEDGVGLTLRNVCTDLSDYTATHPTILEVSNAVSPRPRNSQSPLTLVQPDQCGLAKPNVQSLLLQPNHWDSEMRPRVTLRSAQKKHKYSHVNIRSRAAERMALMSKMALRKDSLADRPNFLFLLPDQHLVF
jgi:hypothetical protein